MTVERHVPKLSLAISAIGLVLFATLAFAQGSFEGHTLPHLWQEPRIFHAPLGMEEKGLLTMDRVREPLEAGTKRVLYPSKAYWFVWRRQGSPLTSGLRLWPSGSAPHRAWPSVLRRYRLRLDTGSDYLAPEAVGMGPLSSLQLLLLPPTPPQEAQPS